MTAARITRRILAFVLAAVIAAPAAAFTADEQAWIDTIQAFLGETSDMGVRSTIVVAKDPKDGASPVSSGWLAGRCVLIVSVAGNSQSRTVQGYARNPATARLASVAHEFAHCLHIASLQRGETQLPPVQSPEAEAWADAWAVLWIYCTHPEKYRDALTFFRTMRTREPSALYSLSVAAINDAAAEAQRGNACSAPRPLLGAV
jgi:hypothetical protein